MKTVYLAGPIKGLTYDAATDWRRIATKVLAQDNIRGVSPMRAKTFLAERGILDENTPLKNNIERAIAAPPGFTTRDRYDVTRCDIMLANLLEAEKTSVGTVIEYGWADSARKPIITVIEKERNPHDHGMINQLSGYRVETLEEGLVIAKSILLD